MYAALAYYFENREFVDGQILEGEEFSDRLFAGQPSILEKVRQMRMAIAPEKAIPWDAASLRSTSPCE